MWLIASSCSTAVGTHKDQLWSALMDGRDGSTTSSLGTGYFWSSEAPFHQRINDELDRVYGEIREQIPTGSLGVILASTKGYVEDFISEAAPSSEEDPVGAVLSEFLARNALKPHRAICVSNACASSHAAVFLADMWLKRKDVDHVLILCVDAIGTFVTRGFQSLGLVTPEVCRPFAEGRTGLRLGEAAVAILVSRLQTSSLKIESVSIDSEGSPVSRPSSSGRSLQRAMMKAMGPSRSDAIVDAIVAHGTGTVINDQIEDQIFSTCFPGTPITGTKWCVGHTLGASGGVDIVAAAQMLQHQQIFSLARTLTLDPKLTGRYVTEPLTGVLDRILVSSLGFGGTHAALCLKRST